MATPGNFVSAPWPFRGPPSCGEPCPFSPDSRRAGRIFRNLGGIRGVEARGVAPPCSTPLLAVQRRGPCRPAGAPPLFPCPSREGEGVPAGFLPFPARGRGREVTLFSELGASRLPGCLVAWLWGPKILTPVLPRRPLCQDQFEVIERHTQWGLDLLDRYVKFVKERTEVEQAYAKQLR